MTTKDEQDRGMGVPPMRQGRDDDMTFLVRQGSYLPHWTMTGSIYFVTFRLGDSLPKHVLETWLFEREQIEKAAKQMGRILSPDEEQRINHLYSEKVGRYLDAGHGARGQQTLKTHRPLLGTRILRPSHS